MGRQRNGGLRVVRIGVACALALSTIGAVSGCSASGPNGHGGSGSAGSSSSASATSSGAPSASSSASASAGASATPSAPATQGEPSAPATAAAPAAPVDPVKAEQEQIAATNPGLLGKTLPVDCSKTKCMALAFDDGPNPATTPELLKILKENDAVATFFVVGARVQQHAEIVRQEALQGNAIGSHSWSHPVLPKLNDDELYFQFEMSKNIVLAATGQAPSMIRVPYGAVSPRVFAMAKRYNWPIIQWDIDPRDWANRNTETIIHNTLTHARPGGIVVIHDVHVTTVAAVPEIIKGLRAAGYTLVTVPQIVGNFAAHAGQEVFHGMHP